MRLKEESNNWRASGIKKRDARHTHDEPAVKPKSKKNTNKWCKGKVGVLHDIVWQDVKSFLGYSWRSGSCLRCGKKFFK